MVQIQELEAANQELEDANTQMEAQSVQAVQQKIELQKRLQELEAVPVSPPCRKVAMQTINYLEHNG